MNEQLERNIFYDRVKNCDPPKAGRVFSVDCGSMSPEKQNKLVGKMKESFEKMPQKPDEETGLKVDTVKAGYVEMDMPVFDRPAAKRDWTGWKDGELREPKKDLEITTLLEKVKGQKDYKQILALAALGVKHQQNTFDVVEKRIGTLRSYSQFIVVQLDRLEQDLEQLKTLAVLNG